MKAQRQQKETDWDRMIRRHRIKAEWYLARVQESRRIWL